MYLKFCNFNQVIDPAPYFEACKEDVCWAADDDNVCDSMSAYFRECARFGVIVDWRDKDRCGMLELKIKAKYIKINAKISVSVA